MLGSRPSSPPNFCSRKSSVLSPPVLPLKCPNFSSPSILKKPQLQFPKRFQLYAQNGNKKNDLPVENGNNNNGEDEKVKNGPPKFNFRLQDLIFDPDPDNIVAVGLTGLLTWASVQVLWQLFVISGAILIAAVKYTIVAALLIFILITLL